MSRLARRTGSGVFAFLAAAATACLAFAAVPTALAQSGTAATKPATVQQSNVPTIKVTASETVVDVTVTDAKGNPVHGLTRADFTVKEDGKPQPIRSFHEYSKQPVPEQEKLPPNTYSNRQPPAVSNAVDLLWLDLRNIFDPIHQMRAKKEAKKYLQGMPVGTRFAILGSSGPTSLRVVQGITSDPALLSAAIDTLEYDTTSAPYDGEREASWCPKLQQLNQMTLESFDQIAVDVAGIKGRKNLIWFTEGISWITGLAGRPNCLTDDFPEFKKAYSLLAASQVTVFPIDARALLLGASPPQGLLSMEAVAEATGGTMYSGSNDLASFIAQAVDKGSAYYTLTYVPPGSEYDGKHHTIHLEVDRPGLHLTYRDEYYAEDPSKIKSPVGLTLSTTAPEAAGGDMRAAMSRSMPTSSQIIFDVRVEPNTVAVKADDPPVMGTLDARFKDKPLTRYEFNYSISAGRLAYTDGVNGTHNGSVELDISAYDADAKLVTGLSQTITMSLNDKTVANNEPLNFSQQLVLPAGQLFVRIGVLDKTSNKVGTLEIPLKVTSRIVPDSEAPAP
jgi:VWFA-related protein